MDEKRNNKVGPQIRAKEKKKVGYVIGFVSSIAAGLWSSTQYFASGYNQHEALGSNIDGVYWPWAIFNWAGQWYNSRPDEFLMAGSVGGGVLGAGILLMFLTKVIKDNSATANEFMHGSARWADEKQIKEAGLFSDDPYSVVVGGWLDRKGILRYLRHAGGEHVLTYAPTRAGKGVGLVIPTMLSYMGSMVITDLKLELWELTAGWRQKYAKNKVLKFEPASSKGSVKFNPLDEVRLGTDYEIGDVQNIATLIVDPDGKGLESHWQKTSYQLLVGCILHSLYKRKNEGGEASLPSIDKMLSDPNQPVAELWVEMVTYNHTPDGPHIVVAQSAQDMMDRPEEEAGSVLSTAKSYLSLYRDPVVAANVATSDFEIADLMRHDSPVSLYIATQPVDKNRLRPLVRILISMIIRKLADGLTFEGGRPVANYKHPLLCMLDEFPSLGKLEIVQESLAFLAGYGIRMYLITQDINQLTSEKTGYGRDEQISSNAHIQNAYPPNRNDTAAFLSKRTGQTTVVKKQVTVSGNRMVLVQGNSSTTLQEVGRPLLTEDECLRLPGPKKDGNLIVEGGDMIITVAGYPAIYGRQILYFKDPVFSARASIPAPAVSDVTINAIKVKQVEL